MVNKRPFGRRIGAAVAACGAAAAFTAVAAVPASATANGCNGYVCIHVDGNATSYTVEGSSRDSFYGHLQFQGPNLSGNTGNAQNPNGSANGHGAGQVCVTGWEKSGSGWVQVGKPCETVR